MIQVKKNDSVMIRSGKDKGKQGEILAVLPREKKVKVKGAALMTVHKKKRRQSDTAGIVTQEGWLDASAVMVVCTACKVPSRMGGAVTSEGKKVRQCKRCKEII